jgi:hypothetical protein
MFHKAPLHTAIQADRAREIGVARAPAARRRPRRRGREPFVGIVETSGSLSIGAKDRHQRPACEALWALATAAVAAPTGNGLAGAGFRVPGGDSPGLSSVAAAARSKLAAGPDGEDLRLASFGQSSLTRTCSQPSGSSASSRSSVSNGRVPTAAQAVEPVTGDP